MNEVSTPGSASAEASSWSRRARTGVRLSVVLATYERRALLSRTLETLARQGASSEDFEVVVVVDGSRDGTHEMLRALDAPYDLTVVSQPNRGQAAALDAGVAAARGALVLLLDDDILCAPEVVAAHLEAHSGAERLVAFGPVLMSADSPPSSAVDLTREWTEGHAARAADGRAEDPGDVKLGPNCSLARSLYVDAGGYDPVFTRFHLDTDLGLRVRERGATFRYVSGAVTHQLYLKRPDDLVSAAAWVGRDQVLLSRRHPDFRAHSALALLADGPPWKVLLRRGLLRSPLPVEPLLRGPFDLCERLRGRGPFRSLAVSLLRARCALVHYRAAQQAVGSWNELANQWGATLPVLLYHHVGEPRPGAWPELTVSPRELARQIAWLERHGYQGVTTAQWAAWRRRAAPLPEKPVLITFDDAYADLVENAFPVLERSGFAATLFVVTDAIGGASEWDRARGHPKFPIMTAKQIREWARRGIEIASHGRTHRSLPSCTEAELEEELRGSRASLEELVGQPVTALAYPFGDTDDRVERAALRTYELAFGLETGLNTLRTPPGRMRRSIVRPGDGAADFACRVGLGWNPIDAARSHLRRA